MAVMGAMLIFSTVTGETESAKLLEIEPTASVQLQVEAINHQ